MGKESANHIQEERLEAYAMGLIADAELPPVEEHLLFCTTCLDQLEEIEHYTSRMRGGSQRIRAEEQAQVAPALLDRLRALLRLPIPVWGGAIVLATLILVVSLRV